MNKRQLNMQKHFTMDKFLRTYCDINNEETIKRLSELSHKEVKKVCKIVYGVELTTLSFKTLEKEEIITGEAILVVDRYNNLVPYRNPSKTLEDLVLDDSETSYVSEGTFDYNDYIDIIEDNLTLKDVDIKSIGSFKIKRRQ